MSTGHRAVAVLAVLVASATLASAQTARPRASLQPADAEVRLAPGAMAELVLNVSMPPEVHVQAHQPKDPLLIATVLSVEAPAGVRVESIAYPAPSEFTQTGRPEPLLVLGPRFDIRVRLSVAAMPAPASAVSRWCCAIRRATTPSASRRRGPRRRGRSPWEANSRVESRQARAGVGRGATTCRPADQRGRPGATAPLAACGPVGFRSGPGAACRPDDR